MTDPWGWLEGPCTICGKESRLSRRRRNRFGYCTYETFCVKCKAGKVAMSVAKRLQDPAQKEIVYERNRRWQRDNIDWTRAYRNKKKSDPLYRRRASRNAKRYRQNPLNAPKIKARKAVAYAVRVGKLTKLPCEVCRDPNVQAHHDDYLKPLNVKWFCPLHHARYERVGDNVFAQC